MEGLIIDVKDLKLETVKMRLEDAEYIFEVKEDENKNLSQEWKVNIQNQTSGQSVKKSDIKRQLDSVIQQNSELELRIIQMHEDIESIKKKVALSLKENKRLSDRYVIEYLETERVRVVREKLDKLKKDLMIWAWKREIYTISRG